MAKGEPMTLCSEGHDEVCYEERDCPMCKLLEENKILTAEIENLKEEINNAE